MATGVPGLKVDSWSKGQADLLNGLPEHQQATARAVYEAFVGPVSVTAKEDGVIAFRGIEPKSQHGRGSDADADAVSEASPPYTVECIPRAGGDFDISHSGGVNLKRGAEGYFKTPAAPPANAIAREVFVRSYAVLEANKMVPPLREIMQAVQAVEGQTGGAIGILEPDTKGFCIVGVRKQAQPAATAEDGARFQALYGKANVSVVFLHRDTDWVGIAAIDTAQSSVDPVRSLGNRVTSVAAAAKEFAACVEVLLSIEAPGAKESPPAATTGEEAEPLEVA